MATKDEVLQAIADEKAQVQAALAVQDERIAALQAQIDAGGIVTAADLEAIKQAVSGIYEPST